jgi:hypothetical protein
MMIKSLFRCVFGAAVLFIGMQAAAASYTLTEVIRAGEGGFLGFTAPALNNTGAIAFKAGVLANVGGNITTGEEIVVLDGGVIKKIADTEGKFQGFTSFSLNDNDDVAFAARLDGPGQRQEINLRVGATETLIADTSGAFRSFASSANEVSLNNNGLVAFGAELDTAGSEINVSDGVATTLIADTSGEFRVVSNPVINDSDEVAYAVTFDGGGQAINFNDGTTTISLVDTNGRFAFLFDYALNNSLFSARRRY